MCAHTLNIYIYLFAERDKEFAGHLVRNLEGANQEVPSYLLELAMQSSWFRKSRFKSGKGKSMNVGGCGLGFKERPRRTGGGGGGVTAPDVAQHIGATLAKSGPATDRLSAMKAAFKSQYQTQVRYTDIHSEPYLYILSNISIYSCV